MEDEKKPRATVIRFGSTTPAEPKESAPPPPPEARVLTFEGSAAPLAVEPPSTPSRSLVKPLFAGTPAAKKEEFTGPAVLQFQGTFKRERIDAPLEALQTLNTDIQSAESLVRAREIIHWINLADDFREFGTEAQRGYTVVSEKIVTLTTNPLLEATQKQLQKLAESIAETTPEQKDRWWSRFPWLTEALNLDSEDATKELRHKLSSVKRRNTDLTNRLPALKTLSLEIPSRRSELTECLIQINAYIAASRFLLDYLRLKNEYATISETINRRLDSIMTTRLIVMQSFLSLDVVERGICNFINTIENALLLMVPSWYNSFMMSMVSKEKDPTKQRETILNLQQTKQQILQLLGWKE